ncbi:ribonuclease III [Candidatus Campbellbacteria bacterium CG22_combo_CG10-13_8_21_14_all_36_13]|uniref:Ribonuclease 3 n=1 Tax=Candidatus Campbellbacteria bacterium CG22_combo_CG10-13_8_21_14_all_36_13 TaxID=1974529 RepID=A0A2H0DYP2_9BACT|nr:MAG: ribonuclease III [Candidatus Campbellbacteria bacterium CG22_combo_CG10-13_8_21_14_all_36_13]
MNKNFEEFEDKIGVTFKDKELLRRAFTHRSYVNENKSVKKHNERLEFLGDAVLELIITEYLFEKYPNKPEGELTAVRAALVNTQSISEAAKELGMNDFLLLSKGESKDVGRARQYILANVFEALLGAIYLDQGYAVAKEHISKTLFDKTDKIVDNKLWQDAKSYLQERAQEDVNITPTYKTVKEDGPDHDKHFTVSVMFDNKEIAIGMGKSKQEAEQDAARKALALKEWN